MRRRWIFILLCLLRPLAVSANLPRNAFPFSPNGGPTITNIFDVGQHLCQVKLVGGAATLFYDAQAFDEIGRVKGINFGNGTASSYTFYDLSKRLSQLATTSHSTNVQSLSYKYNQIGSLTNIADNVTSHTGGASATMTNAVYDDLDRLTSAGWTGYGLKNFAYDKIGNVLTNGESGSGAYSYGTIRPHFVRSANGVWFTSDQNGNVVFRGGQRLEYNINNELSLVLNTNGTLTKFGYGGGGERLWKSSSTNSLQVWIGAAYEEKNGKVLYHVVAGGRLVCTFDSTGTNVLEYYHPDHLTSSSIQTDPGGAVIQHYEYSAFGQSRYTLSGTAFPVSRRYTSQILDEDTGLYYYNSRYYIPELARFGQADDIISDIGNPQSWNRYSYVLNNPLRYTDPSGHREEFGEFTVLSSGYIGKGSGVLQPFAGSYGLSGGLNPAERAVMNMGIAISRGDVRREEIYGAQVANALGGSPAVTLGILQFGSENPREMSDYLLGTYTGFLMSMGSIKAPGGPEIRLGETLPSSGGVDEGMTKQALDSVYPRVKLSKGARSEIFERAKTSEGKVYDPSGVEIKPGEPWQAGHKPGQKFSDAQKNAAAQGMDSETWKAYQRDPDLYRPEKARTNLGHKHETE